MGMMMINLSARPFAFRQKYLLVSFKREIAYHLLILRHFFPFHIPPIFFSLSPFRPFISNFLHLPRRTSGKYYGNVGILRDAHLVIFPPTGAQSP